MVVLVNWKKVRVVGVREWVGISFWRKIEREVKLEGSFVGVFRVLVFFLEIVRILIFLFKNGGNGRGKDLMDLIIYVNYIILG